MLPLDMPLVTSCEFLVPLPCVEAPVASSQVFSVLVTHFGGVYPLVDFLEKYVEENFIRICLQMSLFTLTLGE